VALKINTAPLSWAGGLTNRVSIDNTSRTGRNVRVILKVEDFIALCKDPGEVSSVQRIFSGLIPPWKLVEGFRAGQWTWDDFEAVYRDRLKGMDLQRDLEFLAELLGVSELTLCCRGGRDDEHTHRKLLYDALPEDMKGVRD
jgi:uncharacterized protein YeaO (DUF488 family)